MFRFSLYIILLATAAASFAASSRGEASSFKLSEGLPPLRLASATSPDAAGLDSVALAGIYAPSASDALGSDLFETNLSAAAGLDAGFRVDPNEEIVPLGGGKVFLTHLGAIADEDMIASTSKWRMPLPASATLAIIAAVLALGYLIRKRSLESGEADG